MTDPVPVAAAMPPALLGRLAELAPEPFTGPTPMAETAEEKAERLAKAHAAARSRWAVRCPVMYQTADVSQLDANQGGDQLAAWVHNPRNLNLILAGPVGTGKTHAAYAIGNLMLDRGNTVESWTVHDLLEALRPNGDTAPYAPKVDVLLLDDLGAGTPTEWAVETMTALMDERLREHRRTIVTTNVPEDKLAAAWGDRLMDRLRHQATVVVCRGESRRVAAW